LKKCEKISKQLLHVGTTSCGFFGRTAFVNPIFSNKLPLFISELPLLNSAHLPTILRSVRPFEPIPPISFALFINVGLISSGIGPEKSAIVSPVTLSYAPIAADLFFILLDEFCNSELNSFSALKYISYSLSVVDTCPSGPT